MVPYVAEIHRQPVTLCKRVGVHLLYSRQLNLGNLVAPKRPEVDIGFTRGCVYEIPCRDCDVCYVGETKRMLATRCKEHRASCKKIKEGQQLKDSERYDTGVPNHVLETNHEFNFENVKVLRKENNQKR